MEMKSSNKMDKSKQRNKGMSKKKEREKEVKKGNAREKQQREEWERVSEKQFLAPGPQMAVAIATCYPRPSSAVA